MRERDIRHSQAGYALLVFVLVALMGIGLYAVTSINFAPAKNAAKTNESRDQLVRVRDSLVAFLSNNGRLPCPANGTLSTGLADPPGASTTCNSTDGTVPWATLGLSSGDGLDSLGQKLSYRVFSGTNGFTRNNGLLMSDCDSVRAPLPVPQTVGVDTATLLCRTDHNTSPSEFLAGKGIAVNDFGTAVSGLAFVVIAHGKNGLGAYRQDGGRNSLPNVASSEYGNTQSNGPFVAKATSAADIDQTSTNYFDDALIYLGADELANKAKVAARDWPDPLAPTLTTTFSIAALQAAAISQGFTPVGTSLNATSITLNGIVITSSGAAGVEISAGSGTSGEGVGVLGGTATTGGVISGTDVLTLNFPNSGQKFALMLVDFGSSFGQAERAQITFKNGATTVLTTTATSCGVGSVLASYSIDVGATYDTIVLTALTRVGSASSSSFRLAEIAVCPSGASTCVTTSANISTACSYP